MINILSVSHDQFPYHNDNQQKKNKKIQFLMTNALINIIMIISNSYSIQTITPGLKKKMCHTQNKQVILYTNVVIVTEHILLTIVY